MVRGDVWWVNFDPALGTEIKKIRPAVIMSNNASNRHLNRVQVVPLTSNTGKCFPSEAIVMLNEMEHKAMADQIMTADKKRLMNFIGTLSLTDIKKIEHAIKVQLSLPL
jgi:mRNA interferase MazF